jgi:hypothetical protein
MNAEKLLKKMAKEPAMKVGNGDKAYKTLTSAVKAAEAAKEKAYHNAAAAQWASETALNSLERCIETQNAICEAMEKNRRFLTRVSLYATMLFFAFLMATIFCS